MYKVNYTFKEGKHTQMGSFEVSECSFNDSEFFTLVEHFEETSLSILYLSEAPEVYGKTIYLNVKEVEFPLTNEEIEFHVHYNGDGEDSTVRRYEEAFDRLNAFRKEG